ncbi:MAG: PKD domain-containing protein [Chitinophagaceae bacterium]
MKKLVSFLLFATILFACTKVIEKEVTTNTGNNNNNSNTGGVGGSSGGTGTSQPININYTSTSPCAPSNEVFTFTCSGSKVPSNAKFEWYFGDGNNSKDAVAKNTYQWAGHYTVLVKVKTQNDADVGQTTISVTTVGQSVTPVASFYSQMNTNTPTLFSFNSTSSIQNGNISSYEWDFGDGTKGNGSFVNKNFPTYPRDTTYNVKLTVKSEAGCFATRTNPVTVPATYNVSGNITFSSTSACAPSSEEFTFNAPTTGVPSTATYHWDFGDGSVGLGNPVKKKFSFTNTYDVKLIIRNNNLDIYRTTVPVITKGQDVTPTAAFVYNNTTSTGESFNFNSTSTVRSGASITNWAWDFGDGTTGNQINVNKSYTRQSTDRTYTVKLTVTANSGCSHSTTSTVTVPKL